MTPENFGNGFLIVGLCCLMALMVAGTAIILALAWRALCSAVGRPKVLQIGGQVEDRELKELRKLIK